MKRALAALMAIAIVSTLSATFATAAPSPPIDRDEAIEILMSDVIVPSGAGYREAAYMLSEPLENGDVVTSEGGNAYSITEDTWFAFVDDGPYVLGEHAVRYVFIYVETGTYSVVWEVSPPLINGYSLWDEALEALGKGHLIAMYSVLGQPAPITGSASAAPEGDYGDAPDGQDAYRGVPGNFPTLFNTTSSLLPGAHALITGMEMLGQNVSREVDATDPASPDGIPNLVDADSDERMFVILEDSMARLSFDVTVDAAAPDVPRYVNALFDFDQSGHWGGDANGQEWAVVNMEVAVSPGDTATIVTDAFDWGGNDVSPVWMRAALTRDRVDEGLWGPPGGWDGSGEFEYGEIEDSLVFLTEEVPSPDDFPWWSQWPPSPGTPPAGQPGIGELPEPPPAQKPGPRVWHCCTPVKYYYVIVDCGDRSGQSFIKKDCDQMERLIKDQTYDSGVYLKPGNNTKAKIQETLEALKDKVQCADRLFIYITGHGKTDKTGVVIRNEKGHKTGEVLTPKNVDDWLNIPACPGQACDVESKCCFVDIVVNSCHAAGFLNGLARQGRTVATSSQENKAHGGPGGYVAGYVKDMRDPASDTIPAPTGDGYVTPQEAHKTAAEHQAKKHPKDDPGITPDQCDCVCPTPEEVPPENEYCYPRYFCEGELEGACSIRIVDKVYDVHKNVKKVVAKVNGVVEFEADDILLPEYEFSFIVSLPVGTHELSIEAWDCCGNKMLKEEEFTVPLEPTSCIPGLAAWSVIGTVITIGAIAVLMTRKRRVLRGEYIKHEYREGATK